MFKVQRNSKGFTLIELLIVIAIIGILAAIAIPAYTGYTRRAKVQEVVHAMGAVKTAVMAYYTEAGTPPAAATTLTEISTNLGITVPARYLTSMAVDGTTGAITSTFNTVIGGDVTGDLVLTPNANYNTWTWTGANGMPAAYIPKS
jgi:type IV pilus assembly protein PilA